MSMVTPTVPPLPIMATTHRQDYSHSGTVPVTLDGVVGGNLVIADVIL